MVIVIAKQKFYLWRAIDSEGEVLDFLVQRRRNTKAAEKLMRKLLKKQGFAPTVMVTDELGSYGAAKKNLGLKAVHEQGLRKNNRCENSHLPIRRRERKQQKFKSPGSAQRFLNVHAAVYNLFNIDRHLVSRQTMKEGMTWLLPSEAQTLQSNADELHRCDNAVHDAVGNKISASPEAKSST